MSKSFVREAFVLMIAATINRIIGFIYQAVIYRLVGPEGMGLFNLVYPVYILIIVISTAGIPLGISKLVSEEEVHGNRRKSYQILWLSLSILLFSGIIFTISSFLIAPFLGKHVFINKLVYPIFLSLLPGILVVSVSSAFRGFFQGLLNMKPPAVAQIAEQVLRVFAGIALATFLLPRGIQWAAVGIAAASIIGEFFGLIVMLIIFFKQKPLNFKFEFPHFTYSLEILRKLFDMCTPITIGRIAATLMLTADSMIIPLMLKQSGYSTSAATALYGQLTSVALTLLLVPSVITVSLATSLVPAISEAVAQNRPYVVSARTGTAMRVTIMAGIPFITAYLMLPDQIVKAIYGSTSAGYLLNILAIGGIFAYLQQTTTGVLQGLGLPAIPLKNMIVGGIIKILAICTLASKPGSGDFGIIYSYNIFFVLTAVLNVLSLYKQTTFRLHLYTDLFKPLLIGLITAGVFYKAYSIVFKTTGSNGISVIISLLSGFGFYILVLILTGTINKSELNRIPLINKIFRV